VCNMFEIMSDSKRRRKFVDVYRLISDLWFINYASLGVASREMFEQESVWLKLSQSQY
jgi:hypothetical protein